MDRHLTEDELVLHYYGEMIDEAEARATSHMDGCSTCREGLAQLQRVLALVDAVPRAEPDAGFEARAWRRLEPALRNEAPRRPVRLPWSGLTVQSLAWSAAAAAIVLAAFVAGRFWPAAGPAVATVPAPADTANRVFEVALDDHLNRVELALVAFTTASPSEPASELASTEDLIAANRLYRVTATTAGNQSVADVLDELERALIEIAATSSDSTASDVDAVREWIDSRGLLFKVRVMREVLLERPAAPDQRQGTL
jgi:hypothetical protein